MTQYRQGDKVLISEDAWMKLATNMNVSKGIREKLSNMFPREGKIHDMKYAQIGRLPVWIGNIGWEYFNTEDIRPYSHTLNELVLNEEKTS